MRWILHCILSCLILPIFAISIDTRNVNKEDGLSSLMIDTRVSPRTIDIESVQLIRFDSSWCDGSVVCVTVNGDVLTNITFDASGSLLWMPHQTGVYNFEHFDGGKILTASFIVMPGVGVESVIARQRWPWNGLVNLSFTITGESGSKYNTSFAVKDLTGGTNLTMKTLYKSNGALANVLKEQLSSGTYNWVWDAMSDCGAGFVGERVVVEVKAE